LLAALSACAVAALAVWWFVLRDTPAPISVEEVVAGFRESAEEGGAAAGLPEPGVYVYTATGSESVDALIGSVHEYPATMTVTVLHEGCGLVLRWSFLEGRSTTREYCPSSAGLELRRQTEIHTFFGNEETTDYRCDPGSLERPAGDRAGATLGWRCSTGTKTETAEGEVAGVETLTVAGAEVETIHLRAETLLEGVTRGAGGLEVWLDRSTGLLVRQLTWNDNVTDSAVGDVRYQERYELALTSLEPRQ
jgi:hypothetical protein